MAKWETIDTAPKNGTVVWVKRVYEGKVGDEGDAVFGLLREDAPSLQPPAPDPLNRPEVAAFNNDPARIPEREAWRTTPKWLLPNRLYLFPEPTHWSPEATSSLGKVLKSGTRLSDDEKRAIGAGDQLRGRILTRIGVAAYELSCPRAKRDMTPCVARDGGLAVCLRGGATPACVGCDWSLKALSDKEREASGDGAADYLTREKLNGSPLREEGSY